MLQWMETEWRERGENKIRVMITVIGCMDG